MGYDANITRVGAMALFDLKGTKSALRDWVKDALPPFPDAPNTAVRQGETDLLFIGRDHWLLRAPLNQEAMLEVALKSAEAPPDISIVRISDSQAFFAIIGPDAEQIMAIASPLDAHQSIFSENGATYSEAFGLKALIIRRPDGFWVSVEQSFSDMVEDYLTRAMS